MMKKWADGDLERQVVVVVVVFSRFFDSSSLSFGFDSVSREGLGIFFPSVFCEIGLVCLILGSFCFSASNGVNSVTWGESEEFGSCGMTDMCVHVDMSSMDFILLHSRT